MPTIGIGRANDRGTVYRGRVGTPVQNILLACGIRSSLLYAAMLVVVPMRWDAYSSASQTVSELSAIAAPTSGLMADSDPGSSRAAHADRGGQRQGTQTTSSP